MTDDYAAPGEFRVVLRGYDRDQVDAFVREVSERIDALEKERAAVVARLGEGGRADLDGEIDAITGEMNRILHSAHEAAEGMRSRATSDAAQWRTAADEESKHVRSEAQEAAEAVRADAWSSSEALLEQVKAYGAQLTSEAEQDVLTMRAEAEREASRLASAARQEADENVRHSRLEADRMMDSARREAGNLIEAANLEAEAAQERARALEDRRAELMAELDVAQEAISKLEGDLSARRDALASAGAVDTSTVRVVLSDNEDDWFDADETVRVVSGGEMSEPEPVDAVELADEVRELRERREEAESAVAKLLAEVKGEETSTSTSTSTSTPETQVEAEPVAEEPAAEEAQPEPEPVAEEPEPEPVVAAVSEGSDDVDSLFAALRGGGADEAAPPTAVPDAPAAAAAATVVATKAPDVDPFELRDRLLLPVTNSTLRTFKKALVELQNQTLEELREEGEGWRPDRSAFETAFRTDLEELAKESHVAGYAAAGELSGAATSPQPDTPPTNPTNEVAGSLYADVDDVAQRAAASGAAGRQSTAAVSRVFRTWRTDAAERHLRAASLASYHDGLLWGLEALGVASVKGVSDGRMCAECPASVKTAWTPTGSTPKGTGLPPVHLDCACSIIPD